MKKIGVILFLIIIYGSAMACINEYGTTIKGELTDWSGAFSIDTTDYSNYDFSDKAEILLRNFKETGNIEDYSDYGAILVYMGNYDLAKSVYLEIERTHPGLYTTASNLGTLYELIGKNDSALFWIEKAVGINPNSHHGSEWIHIEILKHKLSGNGLTAKSLLDLDFGNDTLPQNLHPDLDSLVHQLHFQLEERTDFISPPNEIVANLFFDFGNAIALEYSLEEALKAYEQAKRFGYGSKLLDIRMAKMRELSKIGEKANQELETSREFTVQKIGAGLIFISLGVLSLFIFFLWRLIKKTNQANQSS